MSSMHGKVTAHKRGFGGVHALVKDGRTWQTLMDGYTALLLEVGSAGMI
jgi:hypothetical protein